MKSLSNATAIGPYRGDAGCGYVRPRRRGPPKITGGTARFTTSRMAKLDWIRATRGNRDSSVR
jgi:hypothetical protein